MSNIKVEVYKKVLKEVAEKYEEDESFINNRTDGICYQERLSAEELIYYPVGFLNFVFPC